MLTVITAIYRSQREPVYDPKTAPRTKKISPRDDFDIEDDERTLVVVYAGNSRVLPDWDSQDSNQENS